MRVETLEQPLPKPENPFREYMTMIWRVRSHGIFQIIFIYHWPLGIAILHTRCI